MLAMYGGILVLALPISVIGNNFERLYDQSLGTFPLDCLYLLPLFAALFPGAFITPDNHYLTLSLFLPLPLSPFPGII